MLRGSTCYTQASDWFLQLDDVVDLLNRTVLGNLLELKKVKGALRAPPETFHEGQVEEVDDVGGLAWPCR